LRRDEGAENVGDRRHRERDGRAQRARRDGGGDRVRRVVESVREIEKERGRDHDEEQACAQGTSAPARARGGCHSRVGSAIFRGDYSRTAATALPASAKSAPAPTRLMVLRTLML